MLRIDSRRKSAHTLAKAHPGALRIDVTSKAPEPWVRFSPFYPHGGIPVPFGGGRTGLSVEGIWQGLKVFEAADVDLTKLEVTSMRGLKRTVRRFGRVRGHRDLETGALLDYARARREIYLPCYRYVLAQCLGDRIDELRRCLATRPVVLLDYETNSDLDDLSKPLSHASLIVRYVTGRW